MNSPSAIAPPVSASAALTDMPVSAATMAAISSRRRSSSRVTASSSSARRTGVNADQSPKARAAASTASPTSAERERANRQISLPVRGETFGSVSPPTAPASWPSIQFGMSAGMPG